MGYDRGDSFPFDFEPNGILFGLKSKGKLSPRSYPIQCEKNWIYSFLTSLVLDIGHYFCSKTKHFFGVFLNIQNISETETSWDGSDVEVFK